MRVGVIGTGALGFHHARLLRRMPGLEFAGIYDKNPARAADVAQQLETIGHPSLEALLERVDAVTVAVPTPVHATVGLAVLERGIALLMEKPLADTLQGAEQLVRRAAEQGVVLQVGHVERFNRAVRAAAPYLDDDLVYRKKQGFGAPMEEWFREGDFGRRCQAAFDRSVLKKEGFFDNTYFSELLQRQMDGNGGYSFHLWTVLNAVLWHESWIAGNPDCF